MPATRVTIGALPEATTPGIGDVTVLETAGVTKKMLITNLLGPANATLNTHITDPTDAHAASAITATPSGVLTGSTVQAQLLTIAGLLVSVPGTNVTVVAHPPLLATSGSLQTAINTICDAIVALQVAITGGTA